MERIVPGNSGYEVGLLVQHLSRYVTALDYIGEWALPVLDAACGTGYGLNILSMRTSCVVGLDNSEKALEEARKLYYYCPHILKQVDLEKKFYCPCSFYGAVTSFETIEHLENPEHFLKNVYNTLWDEGYFVFSIPRTGITQYHKKAYPEFDMVKKLIEEFFIVEKWLGQYHIVGDFENIKEADFWFGIAKKKLEGFSIKSRFVCTKIH